jgi:Spy/CpxP family protein refolding chaperone
VIRPFLAALAFTLALPLAASAQSAPAAPAVPPISSSPATPGAAPAAPHHPHHRSRYFAAIRSLNLSDDQKAQIRGMVRAAKQSNAGADAPTRRANMKQLRAQIAGVLTADQRTRLRTALAQQRAAEAAR